MAVSGMRHRNQPDKADKDAVDTLPHARTECTSPTRKF
jgi:hypothetical protein